MIYKKIAYMSAAAMMVAPAVAGCSLFNKENDNTSNISGSASNIVVPQPSSTVTQNPAEPVQESKCNDGSDSTVFNLDYYVTPELQNVFSKQEYLQAICVAQNFQTKATSEPNILASKQHQVSDWDSLKNFFTPTYWNNNVVNTINIYLNANSVESKDAARKQLSNLAPVDFGELVDGGKLVFNDKAPQSSVKTVIVDTPVYYTPDQKNIVVKIDSNTVVPMFNEKTKKIDVYKFSRSGTYVMQRSGDSVAIGDYSGDYSYDLIESTDQLDVNKYFNQL